MIKFTKGQANDFVVTLTEKCTLVAPNYLFVFKSRQDESIVKFILLNTDNTGVIFRYDKFSVAVNTYFGSSNCGLFSYKVYEQASSINTDETGLNCVETGYMDLLAGSTTDQLQYAGQASTIKVYNGQ
jgi:hypothetical protein